MNIGWENVIVIILVASSAGHLIWRWRNRRKNRAASPCNGDCANCPMWREIHDCVDPPRRVENEPRDEPRGYGP
jgi:hypothetical protein